MALPMTTAPFALPIPYQDAFAALALFAEDPVAAFLDSSDGTGCSYIAVDPIRVIVAEAQGVTVDGLSVAGDPFTVLARELAGRCRPVLPGLPPFQGGAVGFLGYDLGRHLERLPPPWPDDLGLPDMVIGIYETVLAFEHDARRAFVFAPDPARAEALAARLRDTPPPSGKAPTATWLAEVSRAGHEAKVRHVIGAIEAGDVFQVNVAQRFRAELPPGAELPALYRRLRSLSPAPFGAWLGCGGGMRLLSASPERFLRLWPDGRIETRPIKGTRPRGSTPEEDQAQAQALETSVKDRAENLMIVDLLRNDLSKVSAIGSVRVSALCQRETFAHVHHLVSVVEGRLRAGLTAVDLLRATFPGGSVTGAPKIRAMEIIHDMEPWRRGPYCGALAWIGFDGAMDSSIVIRTLIVSGRQVVAHAGGGIVSDSLPAAEYDETMVKAAALLRAAAPGDTPGDAPGDEK